MSIKQKFLSGNGIYMYLRSVCASQASAYTDFIVSYLAFALLRLGSALSTAVGALAGGIVNCIINYKFTFRSKECSYAAIAVKFFLVWLGSLLLNSFGTEWQTNVLIRSEWLDSLNISTETRFLIARIWISFVVSILWNFLLQRYFVFKKNRFDNWIDRLVYRH